MIETTPMGRMLETGCNARYKDVRIVYGPSIESVESLAGKLELREFCLKESIQIYEPRSLDQYIDQVRNAKDKTKKVLEFISERRP